MNPLKPVHRSGFSALSALLLNALVGAVVLGPAYHMQAAPPEGKGSQLIIGRDDDIQTNAAVQGGAGPNQSLNRTDVLEGGPGNDVIFGLNGNDVIDGGP